MARSQRWRQVESRYLQSCKPHPFTEDGTVNDRPRTRQCAEVESRSGVSCADDRAAEIEAQLHAARQGSVYDKTYSPAYEVGWADQAEFGRYCRTKKKVKWIPT